MQIVLNHTYIVEIFVRLFFVARKFIFEISIRFYFTSNNKAAVFTIIFVVCLVGIRYVIELDAIDEYFSNAFQGGACQIKCILPDAAVPQISERNYIKFQM